jgi:hypothetical protein
LVGHGFILFQCCRVGADDIRRCDR